MKASDKQVGGDHYKTLAIEPGEFCQKNCLGAMESYTIKYICRWKLKGGRVDIDKAIHCLELLKEWTNPETSEDQETNPNPGCGGRPQPVKMPIWRL